MKTEEFNQIILDIESQQKDCEMALTEYMLCEEEMSRMSVLKINETIKACRESQSKMDKFITADLYHIIGMGKLNAAQSSRLIKASKKLMSYRNQVKLFACMQLVSLPGSLKGTNYKLTSGVTLSSKKMLTMQNE